MKWLSLISQFFSESGIIQQIGRYYDLHFLPYGLFGRMIVRLLHTTDWIPVYYWNSGIIVEESESNCMENVVIDEGEKKETKKALRHRLLLQLEGYSIQMFVRGCNPQQFIGKLETEII
jgi:hypothetical protein